MTAKSSHLLQSCPPLERWSCSLQWYGQEPGAPGSVLAPFVAMPFAPTSVLAPEVWPLPAVKGNRIKHAPQEGHVSGFTTQPVACQ